MWARDSCCGGGWSQAAVSADQSREPTDRASSYSALPVFTETFYDDINFGRSEQERNGMKWEACLLVKKPTCYLLIKIAFKFSYASL